MHAAGNVKQAMVGGGQIFYTHDTKLAPVFGSKYTTDGKLMNN
jgi:hypothetical protein